MGKRVQEATSMSDLKACPFCGKVPVRCALRGVYCECMTEPLSPERWNERRGEKAAAERTIPGPSRN